MSAPSEFHLFPNLDKDAKLEVVKWLDLESSLSYALIDKESTRLVRERLFKPTYVKIDLAISGYDIGTVPTITMMFDGLPGYDKLFKWSFFEQKKGQNEERKYLQLPTSFSAEGVVLEDFSHSDYSIGSMVSDGDFDKTFTHVEHFLLKELFPPPEQIVVVVDEHFAAKLGHYFESREQLHVAKLKLIGEWKKWDCLKRVLDGYTADELDLGEHWRGDDGFMMDPMTMCLRGLNFSANRVRMHHTAFDKFGEALLYRFRFQRMQLQGSIDSLRMFINVWKRNIDGLRDFSLLTVFCGDAPIDLEGFLRGNRAELDVFSGWQPEEDCYAESNSGELLKITNGYSIVTEPETRIWSSGQCVHFLVLGREFEAIDVEKGRGLEEQKKSKLNGRREQINVNSENVAEQQVVDMKAEIELKLTKIEDGERKINGFDAFLNLVEQ